MRSLLNCCLLQVWCLTNKMWSCRKPKHNNNTDACKIHKPSVITLNITTVTNHYLSHWLLLHFVRVMTSSWCESKTNIHIWATFIQWLIDQQNICRLIFCWSTNRSMSSVLCLYQRTAAVVCANWRNVLIYDSENIWSFTWWQTIKLV